MTTRPVFRKLVLLLVLIQWTCRCSAASIAEGSYDDFSRLADSGKTAEALEIGDRLFKAATAEEPNNAALSLLAKRLVAARQIGDVLAKGAGTGQEKLLQGMAGMENLGLPLPAPPKATRESASLPPTAREQYWNHLRAFSGELPLDRLPAQQAVFLRRYYRLRMQDSIMKIARRIVIADPNSPQNVSNAIVLPLLYLNGQDGGWNELKSLFVLFSPGQLEILSRFSLVEAERPQAAMSISQHVSNTVGKEFSLKAWALAAADTCVANHRPDLAEATLLMVIGDGKEHNTAVELRLKIIDGYSQCGDYATAAQKCRRTMTDYPDGSFYGRVMTTYLGYLAMDDKAEQLVKETESAVRDAKCKPYLAQILYLRWWALRKTNKQDEAVQTSQMLLDQYPANPCVAPILFERATDALARQEYDRCQELLTKLTKDFPGTESAKRAGDILVRLKASTMK